MFILASVFLATGVLRANDLRHDVASLLSSAAHAATDPNAGSHDNGPGSPAPNSAAPGNHPPKPAAKAADSAHQLAAPPADHPPQVAGKPADAAMQANKPDGTPGDKHGSGPVGMAKKADDRCLTGAFLAAALEREQELNAMTLQIDSRKRELQVAEKRVAAQIAELTTQQKALAAAFGQADATAEEEAMQLVAIYEKMKPKQAAQIFDQMPPEIGAGFVRRMRQTSSAQIMANMEPQKAYAISLLLAGRSSAVRKQ